MQTSGDSIFTKRHFYKEQFQTALNSNLCNSIDYLARGGTTSAHLLEAAFHSTGRCHTIFVSVGTNDIKRGVAPTTYQANIQSIATALRARCDVLVFVDLPFTDTRACLYKEKLQGLKNRYPDFVHYLDFAKDLFPHYFKDSVHFNPLGASVLHLNIIDFLYAYYSLLGQSICN